MDPEVIQRNGAVSEFGCYRQIQHHDDDVSELARSQAFKAGGDCHIAKSNLSPPRVKSLVTSLPRSMCFAWRALG